MIVTTTPTVDGYHILGYYGIVFGEVIVSIDSLDNIGLGSAMGTNPKHHEQKLVLARQQALQEMEQRASELEAHAVIGVDLDYEVLDRENMMLVTASGTAVQLISTAQLKREKERHKALENPITPI